MLLIAALGLVVVAGLLLGAADLEPADVVHVLALKLGFVADERLSDSVLWSVRFPRVVAGVVVGGALGAGGAALQGVVRNELAGPQLVGVGPVAGLGAVAGIALTSAGGTPFLMMAGAAVVGAAAALGLRRIEVRLGGGNRFILVGLAVGFTALAWLGAIVLAWDNPRLPTFTFWTFGGLSTATWAAVGSAIGFVVVGLTAAYWHARSLDVLALGDREAKHLGIDVDRVSLIVLGGAGLAIGAAVGLGGIIGFVGLVPPLVLRRTVGPGHRLLLPLSAIGGAVMVVGLDIAARTVAAPIEIPVGLLTAAIGGPVLVWFLLGPGEDR